MQTLAVSRGPNFKVVAVAALIAALAALAGYALLKETRRTTPADASVSAFHDAPRKAFTAEEERYAQALFAIHDQVKSNAVGMMFSGIAFKTGSVDRARFKARIAPTVTTFAAAQSQLEKISAPASMQVLHRRYAEALQLYRAAAETMLKATADGKDTQLLAAHEMSERAAGLLLEVGEQVWPGEYKPN